MNRRRFFGATLLAALTVAASMTVAQQDTGDPAFERIQELLRANDKAAAESVGVDLVSRISAGAPIDSLQLARAQERLAHVRWASMIRIPEALALAESSLAIRRRYLGDDHADVGRSLYTLARVLDEHGNYAEAESTLLRARALQDALGDSLTVARIDAQMGTLFYKTARFPDALPYFERAHPILEPALGATNPEVIRVVYVTGLILHSMGREGDAIPWLEKALAAYESEYGKGSTATAFALNALGAAHSALGHFEEADEYLRAGIDVLETHNGPESQLLSWPLNVSGQLRTNLGDYAGARPLIERAVRLQRGQPNPYPLSTYLGFLAINSSHLGDRPAALETYQEVLAIRREIMDEESVPIGEVYSQIALLEEADGDFESAFGHFAQAGAIYEKEYGAEDFRSGMSHANQASALAQLGRTDEALEHIERSHNVLEKARGPKHPQTATIEQIYGRVLARRGDFADARTHLDRCLAIRREAFGDDHPDVGSTYAQLADVCRSLGDVAASLDFALRAERIGREHLRALASSLSERSALQLAAKRATGLDCALSLAAEHPETVADAWDALIGSRALVLDEMADRLRASWITESPDVRALRDEYTAASRRFAHMLVRGPNDDEPDAYRTDLAQSRDQRDRAESALASASAGFRRRRDDIAADLARVASSLPEGACLVSYAQFGDVSPSMLAFVLESPDATPVAISLGTVARIDDAVSRWRHEASRGTLIAGRTDAQALDAYRAAGVRLRELVWDPLELPLDGRRIFLVPDGALHLVNFAALPADGGRYLLDEDVLLHASSTERDLLPSNESVASGLLAVGGATFDDTIADAAPALPTFRGTLADCDAFRGVRFAPLPASREESEQVAALWRTIGRGDVLLLEGDDANERAVKGGAPGRRVLHFATHGFFLDPDCVESSSGGTRGIAGLAPTRRRTHDPAMRALRLAGIALAGANRRDAATNEDGILTAEEIATLDLGGVQWAVLSACDTGTGDVDAREGIFGLRRAFRIAGARTVISSLWSVRDEDALVWMDELYRARLVDELDAATCTRRAARRLLEQARSGGRSTHPFAWAGFVAAGDWR